MIRKVDFDLFPFYQKPNLTLWTTFGPPLFDDPEYLLRIVEMGVQKWSSKGGPKEGYHGIHSDGVIEGFFWTPFFDRFLTFSSLFHFSTTFGHFFENCRKSVRKWSKSGKMTKKCEIGQKGGSQKNPH